MNIAKDIHSWKLLLDGSNLNYIFPYLSDLPDLVKNQSTPLKWSNPFKIYGKENNTGQLSCYQDLSLTKLELKPANYFLFLYIKGISQLINHVALKMHFMIIH